MTDPTSTSKDAPHAPVAREPRVPMRTCVGCQERFPADGSSAADGHVRLVLGPTEGAGKPEVAVDFAGTSFGRGAHVHVRPSCVERACRGGLSRAFKRPVAANPKALAGQIVAGAHHRIRGLLLGARRGGHLAFGDEAREVIASEKAGLALVAVDAGASGTKGALLGALRDGKVVAYGTKAELGVLFGREEVAVVAVTHAGLAEQIHCARAAADAVSVLAGGGGS